MSANKSTRLDFKKPPADGLFLDSRAFIVHLCLKWEMKFLMFLFTSLRVQQTNECQIPAVFSNLELADSHS
jgi:hypothetical protein